MYLQMCRELGLVPVSYYTRHCEEALLNFRHRGLGTQGVRAVCAALATNTVVYTLDLSDNWMGPQGLECVAQLLQYSHIGELHLAQNNLGSAGAKLIGELLYNNPTHLKRLNIANNKFQDSDATHIAYGLDGNDRLISIDLSHNEFGVQAGKIFSNQIAVTTLEQVDMSWNHFRAAGAVALATAIKVTPINHLNLAWNGFGEEGGILIGRSMLVNTALQYLDVSSNRIGVNGAIAIAKALEKNETLMTIKLAKNPITYEGSLALIRALAKNPVSPLKLLDLKDVYVPREFDTLCAQLKAIREIQINYVCGDCHVKEISLKTRRITTTEERLNRARQIAVDNTLNLYQILDDLEEDVVSAIEFRNWLELYTQMTKTLVPRVACDELALCLSTDGNIYKMEILDLLDSSLAPETTKP
uniref:Uncharacterized protein n=1 Tax=Strigamia maritima TaxID=126957 RepID=T1IH37_STRMM